MNASNSFLAFSILARTLLADANDIHVQCDGKDYGELSPYILKADLVTKESFPPLLVSTLFKKTEHGELQVVNSEIHLAKDKVCGVNVEFNKECNWRLRKFQGDYALEFKCGERAYGEADTNLATATDGILTLNCKKPTMTPTVFEGCKVVVDSL